MPSIKKALSAPQGKAMSNRYKFRHFKHAQDMHAFLATGDNSLQWQVSVHDLKSGVYASQLGIDRATNKAVETFTKV